MLNRVKIRFFRKEDVKQLAQLDLIWKREGISPGFCARKGKWFLRDSKKAICFIAELNNKIVGYAFGKKKRFSVKKKVFCLKKGEKYLLFDSLYVFKKYRHINIGKKLILALIKESKKQGFYSVLLDADSKEQEKLVSLYKNCDFGYVFTRMKLLLK